MKTLALLAAVLVTGAAVFPEAQSGQTPARERRFDVASVKPGLSPYEAGRQAGLAERTGEKVGSLEKQLGPMPVVVVDAAEHPTPD